MLRRPKGTLLTGAEPWRALLQSVRKTRLRATRNGTQFPATSTALPLQLPLTPWKNGQDAARRLRAVDEGRFNLSEGWERFALSGGRASATGRRSRQERRGLPWHGAAALSLDLHRSVERRPLASLSLSHFIDPEVGPVRRTRRLLNGAQRLPVVSAQLATEAGALQVYGVGRAKNFEAARQIAILEALERHHGLHDQTGRPVIHGAAREFSGRARTIDCAELGLYRPEQYRRPQFPCRPYHPGEPLNWVQGWCVGSGEDVLIPSEFVYYGDLPPRPLVFESSNGCSIGSSREEAIYHGLLELLERDAALRWWTAPTVRQLDGAALHRGEAALVMDVIAAQGYTLRFFDATLTVPSVVVVASTPSGGPALLCACGAHPDPQQAAERALVELSSAVGWGRHWTLAERRRARRLADAPLDVAGLADHPLCYADARAAAALERWLARSVSASLPAHEPKPSLWQLMAPLHARNVDILAVDQTSFSLQSTGLVCVKVLAPGLVPMHYGAQLSRALPGERWPEMTPHPFS